MVAGAGEGDPAPALDGEPVASLDFVAAPPPVADADKEAAGGQADAGQGAMGGPGDREEEKEKEVGGNQSQGGACSGAGGEEKEEPPPLSEEQALLIFSLRSQQTCGHNEVHKAAAGRSTVVSELLDVPASVIRALWMRQIMVDVTEPYWTEREQLLHACEKFKSEGGSATSAAGIAHIVLSNPSLPSPLRLLTFAVSSFRPLLARARFPRKRLCASANRRW